MKNVMRRCINGAKDVIALIIISTYCITFIAVTVVPHLHFNEVMSRQFERIMIMVVSFYFGYHKSKKEESEGVD